MTADWDALVDAAPPEVREALDRLRHHVVLTTPGAESVGVPGSTWTGRAEVHAAAREAMGAVLAWMADQNECGEAAPAIHVGDGLLRAEFCRRASGHRGWHRGRDGSKWIDTDQLEAMRAEEATTS